MAQSVSDEGLRCSICLESFKEPKVLPCCHTFCKGCLSKLPVMKKPESELSENLSVTDRNDKVSLESVSECGIVHHLDDQDSESSSSSGEIVEPPKVLAPLGYGFSPQPAIIISHERAHEESQVLPLKPVIIADSDSSSVAETDSLRELDIAIEGEAVLSFEPTAFQVKEPPIDLVNYITCPQCRAEHKLIEPNGVDGFLADFFIESQLREQSSSLKNGCNLTQCDGCDENSEPVIACCSSCAEYLCDFCFKAHKKLKKFAGHNVQELADLDKEIVILRKPHGKYVCLQHPVESVQLYCQSCNTVVCNKCIVSCVHSGHITSEIDSLTRKKVCKQLLSLSSKVDLGLKAQVKGLDYIKKVEKATNNMATDVQQKINSVFDSYIAALGKRRKELLTDSESKCNKKMKLLWSEKDSLERVVADMTTTQNFTKRIQNCEDDKEFLLLASQALPRLKKLENWEWNDREIEEIERYMLSFQESDLDVDELSRAGRLHEAKSLNIYKIEFQGFTDTATLGEQHSFTFHVTKGKSCRPWTIIETPKVTLKHVQSHTCEVADISITRIDIESQKSASFDSMDDEKKWEITNDWMITYTPYCGGRHRLTIQVENTLTHVEKIIVHGTPPVGSAIIDGPNSSSNYGIDGTVVSEFDYISDTVDVQVHERYYGRNYSSTKTFSWGKNGRYEIQLRHSITPLKVYKAAEAF